MGKLAISVVVSQGKLSLSRMALVRGANVALDLSYIVGQKGHTTMHTQWLTIETLKYNFPILVEEVGTLPTLNGEKLGNQEKITNLKHLDNKEKSHYFLCTI